jgi:hypothetical protein
MTRSLIAFGLAAALVSAGCVPVTEPVGDIDKAEPNKDLLGEWRDDKSESTLIVDRPDVKGNPKGLMRIRVVEKGKKLEHEGIWAFTTTVGKHTYINVLIGKKENEPNLNTEGAFAEWLKSEYHGYWVGRLTFKDDTLITDGGDKKAFEKLMAANKIAPAGDFFAPESGWLAAYLEKNGPDAIFTGKDETKYTRIKGK